MEFKLVKTPDKYIYFDKDFVMIDKITKKPIGNLEVTKTKEKLDFILHKLFYEGYGTCRIIIENQDTSTYYTVGTHAYKDGNDYYFTLRRADNPTNRIIQNINGIPHAIIIALVEKVQDMQTFRRSGVVTTKTLKYHIKYLTTIPVDSLQAKNYVQYKFS